MRRSKRYGRLDVLVHNAGIVRRASLTEMTYDDFDAVLDVHLRGAFHVVRPAFPPMCDAGYGRIVLTSSIGGLYGNHDVANYAAAKAGIIGLSNVVAIEGAAHGVKSNVIVPAAVTRMAEGHRHLGLPADGSRAGGANGRMAGPRVLLDHRRDPDGHRGPGRQGRRRRDTGRVPAVVDDRAGGRAPRRDPGYQRDR